MTNERTRKLMRELSGESPAESDVTSRTTVVPTGITAPFAPVTGALSVATSLSPTWLDDVQTREPVAKAISVPAPKDFCDEAAGAGAGAGVGTETGAAGSGRVASGTGSLTRRVGRGDRCTPACAGAEGR